MKSPTEKGIHTMDLKCSCGCSSLEVDYWDDDDGFIFLSHKISSWRALQGSFLTRLKDRLKILWSIAIGKEYYFYEIVLDSREKVVEFKNFVAKIDENRATYD